MRMATGAMKYWEPWNIPNAIPLLYVRVNSKTPCQGPPFQNSPTERVDLTHCLTTWSSTSVLMAIIQNSGRRDFIMCPLFRCLRPLGLALKDRILRRRWLRFRRRGVVLVNGCTRCKGFVRTLPLRCLLKALPNSL